MPLAESLIEGGYDVRGSTTRKEKLPLLRQMGVEAYQILLSEKGFTGPLESFLEGIGQLILDIPPGNRTRPSPDFTGTIRVLLPILEKSGVPHLILVSSTSVFSDGQGRVTETDPPEPDSDRGRLMLEAEGLLGSLEGVQTKVLRLGGLLGPDRHPVHFLSGREIPSGGNRRVNLIRRRDAIGALELLLSRQESQGIFHGVSPEHPSKKEYYTREALFFGIPPPSYQDDPGPAGGKVVVGARLQAMGFRFSQSIYSGA
jgi:nucleoside-diphosphate-sugar epimerase